MDPVPTKLLKGIFPTVGPFIFILFNNSLSVDIVPDVLKHPYSVLLINYTLIPQFYLISNLSFISKILKMCIFNQSAFLFLESNSEIPVWYQVSAQYRVCTKKFTITLPYLLLEVPRTRYRHWGDHTLPPSQTWTFLNPG